MKSKNYKDAHPVTFEKAKSILNSNGEFYTDTQIKDIMALMSMWAKINARTIVNKLHELKNQNPEHP